MERERHSLLRLQGCKEASWVEEAFEADTWEVNILERAGKGLAGLF